MAREPKVVDVEAVEKGRLLRRIILLLLLAVGGAALWYTYRQARTAPALPASAEATGVRSTVYPAGDSLEVAVAWEFQPDSLRMAPESVRVEVGLADGRQTSVSTQSADRNSDTLRVAAPPPGETASGYSCVAPIHRGQLRKESCTPWQFVQPAADTAPTARADTGKAAPPRAAARRAASVSRVVVQPAGLQVDPDPDGRCARWQRENPGRSVWVEVNRQAVPQCTGANGKPMVAQFCAFAELADGRRVITENSAGNPYCAGLYREWAGERIS